ncbi:hypothetical protein ACFQ0G_44930 [Streptomyces chiangmaiensis]
MNSSTSRAGSPQGSQRPRRRLAATAAIAVAVLAVSALPAGATSASNPSGDNRALGALPQVKATARPGVAAMRLSPGQRQRLLDQAVDAAPDTARSLRLGPQEKLIPKDVIEDADGTVHTRYERTYAGLPVLGGDLVVHQRHGPRTVTYASKAKLTVPTTKAKVSADAAKKSALSTAAAKGTRKAGSHSAPARSSG